MSVEIPDLYIRTRAQDFSAGQNDGSNFIGRKEIKERIKRRIRPCPVKQANNSSTGYQGAYLIAGYRGMGKSTLVQKAVSEINMNFDENRIMKIDVFLSQGELSDFDLLRQMFIQLRSKIISVEWIRYPKNIKPFLLLFSYLINLTLFLVLYFFCHNQINQVLPVFSILFFILYIFLCISTYHFLKLILKRKSELNKNKILLDKIHNVNSRLHSDFEVSNTSDPRKVSSILDTFQVGSSIPFSFFQDEIDLPSKLSYQKITSKELEFELKEVLTLFADLRLTRAKRKRRSQPVEILNNVLFVIDELDKLEPEYAKDSSDYLEWGKTRLENRKEKIISLLANLKSFIHTSEAKFIFIGGAEIYDATLADVADRESFYSTIFEEVFYLNTFFKDQLDHRRNGISQMVDYYLLRKILYSNENIEDYVNTTYSNYRSFYDNIDKSNLSRQQKDFVLFQINRFLIYLTYRCNGSPKKLKALIEHNLIDISTVSKSKNSDQDYVDSKILRSESIVLDYDIKNRQYQKKYANSKVSEGQYLRIKYDLQYKTGLHSSIFLPFLISTENHLKKFNDKNLYLTAFLLDHILKFHKSAFSWRELEMMPDIIIGSRGPSLRDLMNEIIEFLSIKHLRETTNAMFQYKFRSRVSMELQYISKISNESAAAFNFTYDESQHLKAFFKRKLKQKIEANKNNKTIGDAQFNHTISYLNSLIADLHFYDEEYGSAIRYYSDSIQPLRDKEKVVNGHQNMLFTRDRLLLGLCLEKSKRYDSAYSVIRNLLMDLSKDVFKYTIDSNLSLSWEDPYKRMQLFLRPHLSLLMLIEKERSDGITVNNLQRNIKEYTEFLGLNDLFPAREFVPALSPNDMFKVPNKRSDSKRVQTLLADYYHSVGSILFYKSRNFSELYANAVSGILYGDFKLIGFKKWNGSARKISDYNNILKFFSVSQSFYFPAFTSFFYYCISLGHLMKPYMDSLQELYRYKYINGCIYNVDLSVKLFLLEKLAYDRKAVHILSSKQKEMIGLVLSKLSDSILSILGGNKRPLIVNCNFSFDFLFDHNNPSVEVNHSSVKYFDELFSLNSVIYFNVLSYRFYLISDKHFDSLFLLKKCLYIINVHQAFSKSSQNLNTDNTGPRFQTKLMDWIKNTSKELIVFQSISYRNYESEFFKLITKNKFESFDLLKNEDELEISLLMDRFSLLVNGLENNTLLGALEKIETISSIFVRVQYLKYFIDLIYVKLKDHMQVLINSDSTCFDEYFNGIDDDILDNLDSYLYDVIFCFKNIIIIINTYGYRYSISNCYVGSVYRHLLVWCKLFDRIYSVLSSSKVSNDRTNRLIDVLGERTSLFNYNACLSKSIEHYEKALSLHSEGAEYKRVIKDMFILEDDFNDGQIHFFAALERSLINSGLIDIYLRKLKKLAKEAQSEGLT